MESLNQTESLNQMTSQERLEAYNLLTKAAMHCWSKGKPQPEKIQAALDILIPLTKKDPFFLAHLTSYAFTKTQNKDLQVLTLLANSLSEANGLPFSPGSKYMKPNLRYVSYAAFHKLDPKLALRTALLANNTKFAVDGYLNNATHFSQGLRTAAKKYLKYREENPAMMKGVAKAGLGNRMRTMYKVLRVMPSDDVAKMIHFRIKGKKIAFDKAIDFTGLTDVQIAEKIRNEKLPLQGAIAALEREISPVIAVALLEQATGNQAVIFRKTFEDAGVLKDAEVKKLFEEKIQTAKTALDRVEALTKDADEETKKVMKEARADKRKEQVGDMGKVYLNIDVSSSMSQALDIAKESGAIFAELVQNPQENFKWGLFREYGEELPLPQEFVQDAFAAILFGRTDGGSTNAFSLYPNARAAGSLVDIYITDGGHNAMHMGGSIEDYHRNHPNAVRPRAAVIILVGNYEDNPIKQGYEQNGIPVATIRPNALKESALVAEAVKMAMLGPVALVDEIMNQPLLQLPEYYFSL